MISRRSIFHLPALLVAGLPAWMIGLPGEAAPVRSVSMDPDEPEAYRNLAMLHGDKCYPRVFLDGVEQHRAVMADADRGVVRRHVETPEGNIAHVHGDFLFEEVQGRVDIRVGTWQKSV